MHRTRGRGRDHPTMVVVEIGNDGLVWGEAGSSAGIKGFFFSRLRGRGHLQGVVLGSQWKGRIRGSLQVWFLHTFLILSSPSSQVLIISSCSLNVTILFYCVVNCAESEFSCLLCFGSFPVTWIPLMNNCCVVLLFWARYLINRIITPGFLHLFWILLLAQDAGSSSMAWLLSHGYALFLFVFSFFLSLFMGVVG